MKCGQTFSTGDSLSRHIWSRHGSKADHLRKCGCCSQTFVKTSDLIAHVKAYTDQGLQHDGLNGLHSVVNVEKNEKTVKIDERPNKEITRPAIKTYMRKRKFEPIAKIVQPVQKIIIKEEIDVV